MWTYKQTRVGVHGNRHLRLEHTDDVRKAMSVDRRGRGEMQRVLRGVQKKLKRSSLRGMKTARKKASVKFTSSCRLVALPCSRRLVVRTNGVWIPRAGLWIPSMSGKKNNKRAEARSNRWADVAFLQQRWVKTGTRGAFNIAYLWMACHHLPKDDFVWYGLVDKMKAKTKSEKDLAGFLCHQVQKV